MGAPVQAQTAGAGHGTVLQLRPRPGLQVQGRGSAPEVDLPELQGRTGLGPHQGGRPALHLQVLQEEAPRPELEQRGLGSPLPPQEHLPQGHPPRVHDQAGVLGEGQDHALALPFEGDVLPHAQGLAVAAREHPDGATRRRLPQGHPQAQDVPALPHHDGRIGGQAVGAAQGLGGGLQGLADGRGQGFRVREAPLGVLAEGLAAQLQDGGRQVPDPGDVQRRRLGAQDRVEGGSGRVRHEGALAARKHLVEHHAHGEEVRAHRGAPRVQVFGRHVAHGAHAHVLLREGGAVHQGHAEIRELGLEALALALHQHVGGLQVPVDDAPLVGVGEPFAGLGQELQQLGLPAVPLVDEQLQVLTLDEFHHQVVQALRLAVFEDGDDVRVVQRRRGAGLALEARPGLPLEGAARLDRLDGHLPPQQGVLPQEDLAHGALADAPKDLVLPDLGWQAHAGASSRGGAGWAAPGTSIGSLNVEQEVHHVAVLDDVFLA